MERKRIGILVSILFLLGSLNLTGQNYCKSNRFTDTTYFKDNEIMINNKVEYGEAEDWDGNETILNFDIFYPKLSADSLKKRPVIVLLPGGGFIIRIRKKIRSEAIKLAKQGYVTVSVNYRVGKNDGNNWDITYYKAIYRAVQDSKAALRFLVHNASQYGIDTANIFLGGASAGAMVALYSTFYTPAKWNSADPDFREKLGNIDSSSNNLTDNYSVKGIIDMWGGISDTADISPEKAKQIPILILHGTADTIIPYTKARPDQPWLVPVQGGYLIAQRYKHLNGCYQFNTKTNGGHGENFSVDFIAEKIAVFCKCILCGNCKSEEFTTPFIN